MQRRVARPDQSRVAAAPRTLPSSWSYLPDFNAMSSPNQCLLVRIGMTADVDEQRGVVDVGTPARRRGRSLRQPQRDQALRNTCSIGWPKPSRRRARVPRRAPRDEWTHGRYRSSSAKPMPRFADDSGRFRRQWECEDDARAAAVWDSAQILPPWASTSPRAIASPRPAPPPSERALALSAFQKPSKIWLPAGSPSPVSSTAICTLSSAGPTITAIGSDHRARAVSAANPARPQRPRPRSPDQPPLRGSS